MRSWKICASLFFCLNGAAVFGQNCNNPRVSAEFALLNNDICEGSTITIQNTTNDNGNTGVIYVMDWGDGTRDTVNTRDNINHVYDLSEFDACRGSNPDVAMDLRLDAIVPGCETNNHYVIKPVYVKFLPRPQISGDDLLCFPETELRLGNQTCPDNNETTYEWNFGDPASGANNTSTEKSPVHNFSGIGDYTVTLVASNVCGQNSIQKEIKVLDPPVAQAVVFPKDGASALCAPLDLQVTNQSRFVDQYEWDIPNNRNWSFTDNTNRLMEEPVFRILEPGAYTIRLRGIGCGDAIWDTTITVNSLPTVALDSIMSDCREIRLSPDSLVTYGGGEIDTYRWSFPGQTPAFSDEALPGLELVYSTNGRYNIRVEASNECGVARDTAIFRLDSIQVANILPVDSLCSADDPLPLQATPVGGQWEGIVSLAGIFDPGQANLGANQVIYRYGSSNCAVSDTLVITVSGTVVDAGPDLVVCADEQPFNVFPNSSLSGHWRGDGIVNELAGLFSPQVAGAGEHAVEYVVLDTLSGCVNTDTRTIRVSALPEAALGDITGGCVGQPIAFRNNTAGIRSSYWDFGDGATSTESSPFHTYQSKDTFLLSLAVETEDGCRDTLQREIAISEPVNASFTVDRNEGCAALTVNVRNTSTGDADNFEWYLGDSLLSNDFDPGPLTLNPLFRDTIYNLELRVLSGCNNESVSEQFLVYAKPVASFGTVQNNYCSGETVNIGNNSIADSIFWDFGNGQTFSGDRPPSQLYFTEEQYDTFAITAYAFNECGIDTLRKEVVIIPTDADAFISAGDRVACVGEPFTFESFSTPRAAPVEWRFGDGNTASGPLVRHTFSAPGIYEVTAKVISCGFDSITVPIEIRPAPALSLALPDYVCRGDTARLVLNTEAAQHLLYFGDGDSTRLNIAAHVYDSAATYTVTGVAVSADGCVGTTSGLLSVLTPPTPEIILARDSVCALEPLEMRNRNTSLECQWAFGDGDFTVGCVAEHVYRRSGTYSLVLTATDSLGCSERTSRPVYIRELPNADFGFATIDSCGQGLVQFSNRSSGAEAYRWNFGDGATSTETSPLQPFAGPGLYDVRLEAVTAAGCRQSIRRPVEIYVQPEARIALPDSVGCAPFTLPLTNASTPADLNVAWSFGDNTFGYDPQVEHRYDAPGDYRIRLIVSTALCSDTTWQNITVHPPLEITSRQTYNNCFGDADAEIDLTVLSGEAPVAFRWSNGLATEDLQNLPAGTYTYRATDANGCEVSESITIVQPEEAISIEVLENYPVSCFGESDGSLTIKARGGSPNYTYQWSTGDMGISLTGQPAATYEVTVTDSRNCTFVTQLAIGDKDPITFNPDVQPISCYGANDGVIELNLQGGTPPYFNVLTGPSGPQEGNRFDGLSPGDYTISIMDTEGCTETFSTAMPEPPPVTANILPPDTTLRLGYEIALPIRHNQTDPEIIWSPTDDLDLSDPERPIAFPFIDRVYVLTVINDDGCLASDTIRIDVEADRNLFIPNAFTPDDDGHNDVFTVRSDAASRTIVQVNSMRIYDRWGELVFEEKDFPPNDRTYGWNGIFKGVLLPPDVYFYNIEIQYIDREEPVFFQGDVRLFY